MELVEYAKLTREQRLAEKGTEEPCPICKTPRVKRTDYIRCNPCGLNWLSNEDRSLSPLLSREPYLTWKKKYVVIAGGKTASQGSVDSPKATENSTESGW